MSKPTEELPSGWRVTIKKEMLQNDWLERIAVNKGKGTLQHPRPAETAPSTKTRICKVLPLIGPTAQLG